MTLEALLAMLGVKTLDEAAAKLTALNSFISDARAATGTGANSDTLKALQDAMAFKREVEACVGSAGSAALGSLSTWKDAVADLKKERELHSKLQKEITDARCKTMLDEAVESGRLEPAKREKLEESYAKHGIDFIEAAVEALPEAKATTPGERPVAQKKPVAGGPDPKVNLPADDAPATESEKQYMRASGRTLKELRIANKEWAENEEIGPEGTPSVFFAPRTRASVAA